MSGLHATLPAPELPSGPRSALVVGTANYTDPQLRGLRAPATDARALAALLADPSVGGFDVTSVLDPTAQALRIALFDFLAARAPDDLVLVYFSCHGVTDPRRRLYFAAADTARSRLTATGVEAAWVMDQLEECRARSQIVILDCCFSGAFARGAKGDDDLALEERLIPSGRGRAVLTASSAREYSYEGGLDGQVITAGGELAASVFTEALLTGLRSGAADADGDGYVTVDEAYSYAYDLVRARGAAQTPQRWLHGGEGSIILARSPAGRLVTPAPLPESLRGALESPHARVRQGAVEEFGDWLTSADASRRLTARRVLEEVAAEDIPAVARAAQALLERADDHPVGGPQMRSGRSDETPLHIASATGQVREANTGVETGHLAPARRPGSPGGDRRSPGPIEVHLSEDFRLLEPDSYPILLDELLSAQGAADLHITVDQYSEARRSLDDLLNDVGSDVLDARQRRQRFELRQVLTRAEGYDLEVIVAEALRGVLGILTERGQGNPNRLGEVVEETLRLTFDRIRRGPYFSEDEVRDFEFGMRDLDPMAGSKGAPHRTLAEALPRRRGPDLEADSLDALFAAYHAGLFPTFVPRWLSGDELEDGLYSGGPVHEVTNALTFLACAPDVAARRMRSSEPSPLDHVRDVAFLVSLPKKELRELSPEPQFEPYLTVAALPKTTAENHIVPAAVANSLLTHAGRTKAGRAIVPRDLPGWFLLAYPRSWERWDSRSVFAANDRGPAQAGDVPEPSRRASESRPETREDP